MACPSALYYLRPSRRPPQTVTNRHITNYFRSMSPAGYSLYGNSNSKTPSHGRSSGRTRRYSRKRRRPLIRRNFLTNYHGSNYPYPMCYGNTAHICATCINHLGHLAKCIRVCASNLHTFSTRGIATWSYGQTRSKSDIRNGGYTLAARSSCWKSGLSQRRTRRYQSGFSGLGCWCSRRQ